MPEPDSLTSGENINCSFCTKDRKSVVVISGPQGVAICEECVDLCLEILIEDGFRVPSLDRVRSADIPAYQLRRPRHELEELFDNAIQQGRNLTHYGAGRDQKKESSALRDLADWDNYNRTLLLRAFATDSELRAYPRGHDSAGWERFWGEAFRDARERRLRYMVLLRAQLALYEDSPQVPSAAQQATEREGKTIFIVHGHNELRKEQVARLVQRVTGIEPVILHEQPNRGRTVIEKFEDYASISALAIIIVTGDDFGASRDSTIQNPRARQNVVFEFGFFSAALGRSRVALLYEEGVELPSDVKGVVSIELDDSDSWKLQLVRELQAAGLSTA